LQGLFHFALEATEVFGTSIQNASIKSRLWKSLDFRMPEGKSRWTGKVRIK
jgi:hypothetical protein